MLSPWRFSLQPVRSAAAALIAALICLAPAAGRADVLISIDKSTQQMTVAVDGQPRWIWPVSTGRRGYDTPSGVFKPFRLEEEHYSKEWDEAPMPHSIFFTMEGHAIHGSYETRYLGRRASHGCVRLAPGNAARLFSLVKRRGLGNVRVAVTGASDAPLVAKQRAPKPTVRQAQHPAPAAPPQPGSDLPDSATQAFGYAPARPQVESPGFNEVPATPLSLTPAPTEGPAAAPIYVQPLTREGN